MEEVDSINANRQLNREQDRLDTFQCWPYSIDKHLLAKTGFFYLGRKDRTRCHFCRILIKHWVEGDDVIAEHLRWSSSCPLIRRRETDNVPIDAAELDNILPPVFYDVCGPGPSCDHPDPDPETLIKYPEFVYKSQRLATFKSWPLALQQKPEDLASAGLAYTGEGDRVICFSCGMGFKDWEAQDIPIEEHARHTAYCPYLEFIKGKEFCKKVVEKYRLKAQGKKFDEVLEPNEKVIQEEKTCKICYENNANVVFLPCGHIHTCRECAFSLKDCPVCRTTIHSKQRVYF